MVAVKIDGASSRRLGNREIRYCNIQYHSLGCGIGQAPGMFDKKR